jgi:hypothetical protein
MDPFTVKFDGSRFAEVQHGGQLPFQVMASSETGPTVPGASDTTHKSFRWTHDDKVYRVQIKLDDKSWFPESG